MNVGQTFYGFGWEMLLCEALFIAFLGSNDQPPPVMIIVAIWWLVFRLEFGAGMIKIRGGREWRDLTALMYHHETQPMPNPISRQAHLLPKWFHRGEVLGNHFAQLVVPFLLFIPGPVGLIAATIVILTQLWLIATGNPRMAQLDHGRARGIRHHRLGRHWLIPAIPADLHGCRDDAALVVRHRGRGIRAAPRAQLVADQEPPSRRQVAMNASFNRWMLVNAYGAFGTVTKRRIEIVVEGTPTTIPTRTRNGASTPSRASPATCAPCSASGRRTTCGSTGSCGSCRSADSGSRGSRCSSLRLLEADAWTLRLLAHDLFDARSRSGCGPTRTSTGSPPTRSSARPGMAGSAPSSTR